ncbi:hypothetical protein BB560_002378 [Smittium megazygosporum]|uniref:Conserved Oligomeric Golgi complex subunit 6 C-terminal domain-containing protein n=1 Tax=Smittium megazygosporum TaxID=133381 RepID=A0A2T9ZF18_9FUNG|nr:hypothetical protein BB560_002378 [Smittium megazygosporum]
MSEFSDTKQLETTSTLISGNQASHQKGLFSDNTVSALVDLAAFISEFDLIEESGSIREYDNLDTLVQKSSSVTSNTSDKNPVHLKTTRNGSLSSTYEKGEINKLAIKLENLLLDGKLNVKTSQTISEHDKDFLLMLDHVENEIDHILDNSSKVESKISELLDSVALLKQKSSRITEEASFLIEERHELNNRKLLVNKLTGLFNIPENDKEALASEKESTFTADTQFFTALERLKQLISECEIFLKTPNPVAVTDVLVRASRIMETAYNNLYDWTLNELRALLKKKFINALVRGGPRGVPRPIEVHASDPIRYVGDMLAWIHQAQASEVETLHILLPLDIAKPDQNKKSASSEDPNHNFLLDQSEISLSSDLRAILDMCLSGVCHPLELRVSQTIKESNSAFILLQLYFLIGFYKDILSEKLNPSALIILSLQNMFDQCLSQFKHEFGLMFYQEAQSIELPSVALEIPDHIRNIVNLSQELLVLSKSSPTKSTIEGSVEAYSEHKENNSANSDRRTFLDLMASAQLDVISEIILKGFCSRLDKLVAKVDEQSTFFDYEKSIFQWNLMHYIMQG